MPVAPRLKGPRLIVFWRWLYAATFVLGYYGLLCLRPHLYVDAQGRSGPDTGPRRLIGDRELLNVARELCPAKVQHTLLVFSEGLADCRPPCDGVTVHCYDTTDIMEGLQVYCTHRHWTGHLRLYEGQIWRRHDRGLVKEGTYTISDRELLLQWSSWPSETLYVEGAVPTLGAHSVPSGARLVAGPGPTYVARDGGCACRVFEKYVHRQVAAVLMRDGGTFDGLMLDGAQGHVLSILGAGYDYVRPSGGILMHGWEAHFESELALVLGTFPPDNFTMGPAAGMAMWRRGKANPFEELNGNFMSNFLSYYAPLPENRYECAATHRQHVCVLGIPPAAARTQLKDSLCAGSLRPAVQWLCDAVHNTPLLDDPERGCDAVVARAHALTGVAHARRQLLLLDADCDTPPPALAAWAPVQCPGPWSLWARKPNHFTFAYTTKSMHETRVRPALRTWARYTPAVWYSDAEDARPGLPRFRLVDNVVYDTFRKINQGYATLFFRVLSLWHDVFCEYPGHDWYIRLDDDSYLLPTVHRFLVTQDPSQPIVFGGSVWLKFGLLSGGAGWVMSRAALDLLGHNAQWCDRLIRKNPPCRNVYCEDFGLCVCLRELGVRMVGLRGMCWTSPGADCVMPLPRLERFCKEEGMQREVCGTDGVPFTYHKLLGREMEAMHDSIGPCALAAPCPAGMLSNGSAA